MKVSIRSVWKFPIRSVSWEAEGTGGRPMTICDDSNPHGRGLVAAVEPDIRLLPRGRTGGWIFFRRGRARVFRRVVLCRPRSGAGGEVGGGLRNRGRRRLRSRIGETGGPGLMVARDGQDDPLSCPEEVEKLRVGCRYYRRSTERRLSPESRRPEPRGGPELARLPGRRAGGSAVEMQWGTFRLWTGRFPFCSPRACLMPATVVGFVLSSNASKTSPNGGPWRWKIVLVLFFPGRVSPGVFQETLLARPTRSTR